MAEAERQVFVKKAMLAGVDPVPIIAHYPKEPTRARDMHGAECTVFCVPTTAIDETGIRDGVPPTLRSDWREAMEEIVNTEASRRIEEVFPEYMQRNSNADVTASSLKYGTNVGTWPQDAQDRKAESDRGWQFISTVRQTSDALGLDHTLIDPSDDSHWPTAPDPPIYIAPVP
jgi:hypothetical protein